MILGLEKPPEDAQEGDLYFDRIEGNLYLWYEGEYILVIKQPNHWTGEQDTNDNDGI